VYTEQQNKMQHTGAAGVLPMIWCTKCHTQACQAEWRERAEAVTNKRLEESGMKGESSGSEEESGRWEQWQWGREWEVRAVEQKNKKHVVQKKERKSIKKRRSRDSSTRMARMTRVVAAMRRQRRKNAKQVPHLRRLLIPSVPLKGNWKWFLKLINYAMKMTSIASGNGMACQKSNWKAFTHIGKKYVCLSNKKYIL